MTIRFLFIFSVALLIVGLLEETAKVTTTPDIYVYFSSKCEGANDSSHCKPITSETKAWPSFKTMDICMSYADKTLRETSDPTIMGSCQRVKES